MIPDTELTTKPRRITRRGRILWTVLILCVCGVALFAPFYNMLEPRLLGIPFFYWFQFVWVVISGIITALAYKAGN